QHIRNYLKAFFEYQQNNHFDFSDCAFGNLVFSGAFIAAGKRFNQAVIDLSQSFKAKSTLLNISEGENRILVALKEDGQILNCEAAIVSKQSAKRIVGLYLLDQPVPEKVLADLQHRSLDDKHRALEALESPVHISEHAKKALESADLI